MEFCAFESFEFVTILIGEQSTEKWNKHLAENIGKIVGKSLNIRKINSFHFIFLSLGWVQQWVQTCTPLKQIEHLNVLITKQFRDEHKLVIEQGKIVTVFI